jgi:ribosomal protein S6
MFLFDPTFGATFEKCEAEIRRLMDRAGAEIIISQKWDERRLAFRIKGRKRGVYALVYFKASGDKIAGLERDARLSENILRLLVLRADEVTREAMERAFHRHAESPRGEGEAEAGPEREEGVETVPHSAGGRRGGRRRTGREEPSFDAVPEVE